MLQKTESVKIFFFDNIPPKTIYNQRFFHPTAVKQSGVTNFLWKLPLPRSCASLTAEIFKECWIFSILPLSPFLEKENLVSLWKKRQLGVLWCHYLKTVTVKHSISQHFFSDKIDVSQFFFASKIKYFFYRCRWPRLVYIPVFFYNSSSLLNRSWKKLETGGGKKEDH